MTRHLLRPSPPRPLHRTCEGTSTSPDRPYGPLLLSYVVVDEEMREGAPGTCIFTVYGLTSEIVQPLSPRSRPVPGSVVLRRYGVLVRRLSWKVGPQDGYSVVSGTGLWHVPLPATSLLHLRNWLCAGPGRTVRPREDGSITQTPRSKFPRRTHMHLSFVSLRGAVGRPVRGVGNEFGPGRGRPESWDRSEPLPTDNAKEEGEGVNTE